ncbi:MAG: 30S ribosomal protein S3, partial [Candidatus Bathyarchaeota archaeon]
MSVVRHFIDETIKRAEIDEFLQTKLERAGYGGVDITKTPLGTHIVVYAMRPGIVIGRGGETIKDLARILEEMFELPNPQISVAEIEIPELNAYVIASRIASALRRGVHYRRSGYWALSQVIDAGALGVEIIISGKLRGRRAKYEKFRAGYLPKSGEPSLEFIKRAELHVQLKPGIFGVKVRIMPPDVEFPDKINITPLEAEEEPIEATKEEPIEATKEEPIEATKEEPIEATKEEPIEATKEEPIEA